MRKVECLVRSGLLRILQNLGHHTNQAVSYLPIPAPPHQSRPRGNRSIMSRVWGYKACLHLDQGSVDGDCFIMVYQPGGSRRRSYIMHICKPQELDGARRGLVSPRGKKYVLFWHRGASAASSVIFFVGRMDRCVAFRPVNCWLMVPSWSMKGRYCSEVASRKVTPKEPSLKTASRGILPAMEWTVCCLYK